MNSPINHSVSAIKNNQLFLWEAQKERNKSVWFHGDFAPLWKNGLNSSLRKQNIALMKPASGE